MDRDDIDRGPDYVAQAFHMVRVVNPGPDFDRFRRVYRALDDARGLAWLNRWQAQRAYDDQADRRIGPALYLEVLEHELEVAEEEFEIADNNFQQVAVLGVELFVRLGAPVNNAFQPREFDQLRFMLEFRPPAPPPERGDDDDDMDDD
jgi:hypothetical protein